MARMWRPAEIHDAASVASQLGACGREVVVDLTQYTPHDTRDLDALVSGVRQYRMEGGNPVFVCPRPGVRRLLETTGITRTVRILDDWPGIASRK